MTGPYEFANGSLSLSSLSSPLEFPFGGTAPGTVLRARSSSPAAALTDRDLKNILVIPPPPFLLIYLDLFPALLLAEVVTTSEAEEEEETRRSRSETRTWPRDHGNKFEI